MSETRWARLPDGALLAYDDYNFTDPWTQAPAVVLVHGFSKNRRFWYEWVPALARDFRVIRVDQRGHGESAAALSADAEVDFARFGDDLACLLDALHLDSAHFVMAELSTSVGVHLAADHPERVLSLVLVGSGALAGRSPASQPRPRVGGDWSQLLREQGTEAWARLTNSVRLPADASQELREWYIAEQARISPDVLIRVFEANSRSPVAAKLGSVLAPTLLLGGSEAMHASPEDLNFAADKMPNARVQIIEGMPYNIMNAAPQASIDATLSFLKAQNRS
jgi:3-oxoadipate enol-lactonase